MSKLFSWGTIIGVVLITALCIWRALHLSFNYDFESYFSHGDEDLAFYLDFRKDFENDSDYLLVSVENPTGIFDQQFMYQIDSLTKSLEALPDVEEVTSPTTLTNIIIPSFGGAVTIPFVHLDQPEKLTSDSSLIYSYPDMVGAYFGPDGKSVALIIKNRSDLSKESSEKAYLALCTTLDSFGFQKHHMAGRLQAENVYVSRMKSEMTLFFAISSVLVVVFLLVAFRAIWGLLIPLVVIALSSIWTLGIMEITGRQIGLMSTLLPTILFVVGMSDVIHMVTKYIEELRKGHDRREAIKFMIKEVGMATLLTSITTAIGFFTLLATNVTPIREFGLYTGIGVVLAFLVAILLLPALLSLMPAPKVAKQESTSLFWHKRLSSLFVWVMHQRKSILIGMFVVLAICLTGISMITTDSYLIDEMDDSEPLKQDFNFFEVHYGGARPFELAIEVLDTNKDVYSWDVIQQMDIVQTHLEDEYGASQIMSPVTFVRGLNRAKNGGLAEYYKIPSTKKAYNKMNRLIKRFEKRKEMSLWIARDKRLARFSGKMHDAGSIIVNKKNEALRELIKTKIDQNLIKVTVTGSAPLIDKSNADLSSNLVLGLLIAFAAIAITMGLLFRNFAIIIISFIPNILPLVMVGAVLGFAGIGLKLATSIIFTIAFGIAVDDTIHFMSKLKIETNKGRSLIYAIKRSFLSTGRAIILTSLILISGFLTLLFSNFNSTFYTGLLVSFTLVFAIVADLLLIPVLLITLYGKRLNKPLK